MPALPGKLQLDKETEGKGETEKEQRGDREPVCWERRV